MKQPGAGHRKPNKHKKRHEGGISLERFGKLKQSSYDPRRIKEKERALNAAKINKLKKLKKRLGDKLELKLLAYRRRPLPLAAG
jgi:hypothetical protein